MSIAAQVKLAVEEMRAVRDSAELSVACTSIARDLQYGARFEEIALNDAGPFPPRTASSLRGTHRPP